MRGKPRTISVMRDLADRQHGAFSHRQLLAHGIGGAQDLPIPLEFFVAGGTAALARMGDAEGLAFLQPVDAHVRRVGAARRPGRGHGRERNVTEMRQTSDDKASDPDRENC